MAFGLEEPLQIVGLEGCRVGNLLVVLVDWWDIPVASMGLVLETDHRDLGLWVFVGMQYVRGELPPDLQV
jgi:hypothetical protein